MINADVILENNNLISYKLDKVIEKIIKINVKVVRIEIFMLKLKNTTK